MTTRKNYNSVVFLTTLSVYLGLVLVGAPAHVLAQAVLTGKIEVKDKVERQDDLDRKPDDEEIESISKKDFPALFVKLLEEIKKQVNSGEIALPLETDFHFNTSFKEAESNGIRSNSAVIDSGISDAKLNLLVWNTFVVEFQRKAFEVADYSDGEFKKAKIRLEADSTFITLKISFTKHQAKQFADFLNQKFISTIQESLFSKQIYEDTNAASENNQVFIVTRLPRGSLDALLAKDGAK